MKNNSAILTIVFAGLLLLFLSDCKKEAVPTVKFVKVQGGNTMRIFEFMVTSDGGAHVTARGICYSLVNQKPTISDSKTNDGTGTGSFESSITVLDPGMPVYVRGYATNRVGTGYSSD
jgi:hypothetical protein